MANEKRLIDEFKNEVMRKFIELCRGNDYNKLSLLRIGETIDRIYEKYRTIPTVEAVEVVHGRWEEYPDRFHVRCTNCRMEFKKDKFPIIRNYCPNCGASMRDGDGNDI